MFPCGANVSGLSEAQTFAVMRSGAAALLHKERDSEHNLSWG